MKKNLIVYGYDEQTGEYTGERYATLCPVTKKVYHFPANTTRKKPLAIKSGEANVFIKGEWTRIADDRGKSVYTKDTAEKVGVINGLHIKLADNHTFKEPVPGGTWSGDDWAVPTPSLEDLNADVDRRRRAAYRDISDPLFFEYQRGEATRQDWLDSIQEIQVNIPKHL